MMRSPVVALLLCLIFPLTAAAAVDGRWTGTLNTPNGEVPVGFTFKTDGSAVTGTTTGPDGMDIAISDGKVDGNTLTFKVSLDFGGMPVELSYKGILSGDEMQMTIDFMGMPLELSLKRTK